MHNRPMQYLTPRSLKSIVLMVLMVVSQPLFAFTFDVGNGITADAPDDNPGDGVCFSTAAGGCTLRAAIQEANAWPGPDTIRLPAGTYNLNIIGANEDNAATGDLDIRDDLTINGADKNTTIIDGKSAIDGQSHDRVFDVVSTDIKFTISNVTVQDGQLDSATVTGAGINNRGELTINDSIIRQNKFTTNGGGGGGIASVQGTATINYSDISSNSASGFAGIQLNLGSLVINNSTITNNSSVGSGGGIGIFNGDAIITDSTISGNAGGNPGGQGGGINNGGHLTLIGTTVENNQVAQGGGIVIIGTGTLTAVNSTIHNNTALAGTGGGILDLSGGASTSGSTPTAILINTTIANNRALGTDNGTDTHNGYGGGLYYGGAKVSLNNTIIANNTANTQGGDCSSGTPFDTTGTLVSLGYNLDSDGTCQLSGSGDKPNTNPSLGSLANNGGPTQTLTLNTGSPALDAGDPSGCKDQSGNTALTKDQRSFPRPDGAACDMGAVEVQQTTLGVADLSVHVTASPAPVTPGNNLTYTISVKNNGPNNATGVNFTDTLQGGPIAASVTSTQGTCSISTVSCSIGALNVGAEAVITITASVPSIITSAFQNIATVVPGGEPDANPNNNSETTTTDVNLSADLQVSMSDSPDPAVLNQDEVTYTMTVTSLTGSGLQTVNNVTLVDNLPGSATLVTGSTKTDTGTCTENGGAGQVTCDLGTMAPGAAAVITLKVKPGVKGTMTNTANVNFDGTDQNPADNKATQDTTVAVVADVSVTATDDRDPVGVKNDLSYIINVKNNGPSPSSDVTLTATLPSGVNFSSASASQGLPCTPPSSGGVVTCDLQAMANDAQATVTIFVVPQNITTIQMTATAQVASDETDPDSSNNNVTESTQVSDNPSKASADLSISLGGSPNPVNTGDTLTYTMTVQNNGPDKATGVVAVLSLPASVTVSSPGSGCSKDSQTNIVRCSLSDLTSGASAQATVGVTPTQSGIIKATSSASFIGSDPDTTNNTANISTTVDAATSSTSSSGGGGGDVGPVTLMALLVLWAGCAPLARRRGSATK